MVTITSFVMIAPFALPVPEGTGRIAISQELVIQHHRKLGVPERRVPESEFLIRLIFLTSIDRIFHFSRILFRG